MKTKHPDLYILAASQFECVSKKIFMLSFTGPGVYFFFFFITKTFYGSNSEKKTEEIKKHYNGSIWPHVSVSP